MKTGVARVARFGSGRLLMIVASLFLIMACSTAAPSGSVAQVPSPSPIGSVASTLPGTGAVASASPASTPTPDEPVEFVPPSPACPPPPDTVGIPDVTASIGDGPAIVATHGSATVSTCSTVGTFDGAPTPPREGLAAHAGDLITLTLPSGWRFLHWDGFDRPIVGDGANVWTGADTPDQPERIQVPVPLRPGESIAGYNLWIIGAEGAVIGNLEILIPVNVT